MEAREFRDRYDEFLAAGATIVGVSADSQKSHRKFIKKHDIPFPLLADTEKVVCNLYGVWTLKKFMGREYMGINRTTFLIDEAGKIARIFEKVRPDGHGEQVLKALDERI